MNIEKYIVKHNNLVFSGTDLNSLEIDIFCTLVSEIDFKAEEFEYLDFNIKEYFNAKNVSNKNYTWVKKQCDVLYNKSLYYEDKNFREDIHIFTKRLINKGDGVVSFKFSEDIRPYLLKLESHFNKYQLKYMLILKNEHCKIMYDYFSSIKNMKYPEIELSESQLRNMLKLENRYKQFSDLKKRVIEVFIKDISNTTDLDIIYKEQNKKRNRERMLVFRVKKKSSVSLNESLNQNWYLDPRFTDLNIAELKRISRKMTEETITSEEEYLQATYESSIKTDIKTNLYSKMKNALENNYVELLQTKSLNTSNSLKYVHKENNLTAAEKLKAKNIKKQYGFGGSDE